MALSFFSPNINFCSYYFLTNHFHFRRDYGVLPHSHHTLCEGLYAHGKQHLQDTGGGYYITAGTEAQWT